MYPLDERIAREVKIAQGLIKKKTREEYLLAHLGLPIRHPMRLRPVEQAPQSISQNNADGSAPIGTSGGSAARRGSSVGAPHSLARASALSGLDQQPRRNSSASLAAEAPSEAGATVAAVEPRASRSAKKAPLKKKNGAVKSGLPVFSESSQDPVMAALLYGPPLFSPELSRCASFSCQLRSSR
mmetsp:Transcript_72482/g.172796  ORF Transcript_72482/g.172796 Transcript_72482/m.172796 type:complete len:184 (+) Transcript_72482:129-680(+)